MKLPEFLYRGDHDPDRIRHLNRSFTAGLMTNLSSGGNPAFIRKQGLFTAVQQHSADEKRDSGFLSFTEDYSVAEHFLRKNLRPRQLEKTSVHEVSAALWFVKLESFVNIEKSPTEGIYCASYRRSLAPRPFQDSVVTLLLIDVVAFQKCNPQLNFEWAEAEREWLVLPTDPDPDGQFNTSILDPGLVDLSTTELYRTV